MAAVENVEEMVQSLMSKHDLFKKYFDNHLAEPEINKQDLETIKTIFKTQFPSFPNDLPVFRCKWVLDTITRENLRRNASDETNLEKEDECRDNIYDSTKHKFVKPQVLPPAKRRRSPKFNVGEFIRQKRLDGEFFELNVQDRDVIEDLLDELSEDKARNDRKADTALNNLAAMATALTGGLNYKVLELHPERRIL